MYLYSSYLFMCFGTFIVSPLPVSCGNKAASCGRCCAPFDSPRSAGPSELNKTIDLCLLHVLFTSFPLACYCAAGRFDRKSGGCVPAFIIFSRKKGGWCRQNPITVTSRFGCNRMVVVVAPQGVWTNNQKQSILCVSATVRWV